MGQHLNYNMFTMFIKIRLLRLVDWNVIVGMQDAGTSSTFVNYITVKSAISVG